MKCRHCGVEIEVVGPGRSTSRRWWWGAVADSGLPRRHCWEGDLVTELHEPDLTPAGVEELLS